MKKILIAALVLVLTGCVAPVPKHTLTTTFNEKEAAALMQPGANTIRGSALIRQNNGGVVTCAGNPVYLVPATNYALERFQAIYKNTGRGYYRQVAPQTESHFTNDDPSYYKSARPTTCDALGFFKFDNLSDGSFFLVTTIQWRVNNYLLEGGSLMLRVNVKGGETKEVTLTP